MKYQLNEMVSVKINGKPGKARVFGYEDTGNIWSYHLEIPDFDLDIKVLESILMQGIDIITNGITLKVLSDNEKAKAK